MRRIALLMISFIVLLAIVSCGGGQQTQTELKLAPVSELDPALRDAPVQVQEAYRFAIANKELLEQIPCFCGCNSVGHTSNYACYVAEDGGPGTVLQFDSHAAGCGICVDITRDVMKMVEQGTSVGKMRETIVTRYGNLGPSTDQ